MDHSVPVHLNVILLLLYAAYEKEAIFDFGSVHDTQFALTVAVIVSGFVELVKYAHLVVPKENQPTDAALLPVLLDHTVKARSALASLLTQNWSYVVPRAAALARSWSCALALPPLTPATPQATSPASTVTRTLKDTCEQLMV
jgi:hypothetical protein